jgi:hypothetical protein
VNDPIVLTKAELHALFRRWELDQRTGHTTPADEFAALGIDEAAGGLAGAFLNYLGRVRAA